ncbi:MAG: transketolase C-terminal domain-containing protein [Rickettsiales bacterium]
MSKMTYSEAAKAALAEAMRTDPTVWAVGEDLGRGGVFGQYLGLEEEFGPERIVSAPISEAAIMGSAVGAALTGTRPIVELRFADFALCAVDEMVNQAAKARYMFGGQAKVPVVIRQPSGMWRSSAAQHSQMLEAWYAHIPGMVVLMPSTPADNYGLLKAAIGCDDPVVYMEHKDLWPLEGEVPEGHAVEIGKASIVREGSDATIVTWSAIRHVAAAAAERLSDDGISAEVIDLRSLWPWDRECVLTSAAKTGRLLVAHEAVRDGGFGAEVAATAAEEIAGLRVARLGAPRIPIPYAPPLEDTVRVTAEDIIGAVKRLAG